MTKSRNKDTIAVVGRSTGSSNREWLRMRHDWLFLQGVAVIRFARTMLDTGEVSSVFHYFLFSHREMTAERFFSLQRKHWCIENKLHWCFDCCFHEDDVHVTLGHAAVVINMFRKLCIQMLKADPSVKDSLTGKRQRCAWSFPYALSVLRNWAFS